MATSGEKNPNPSSSKCMQPILGEILARDIRPKPLLKKRLVVTPQLFFQGWLGMQAPLQWACSGPTKPAVPTNGTVETAGDTSRPYKWVNLQGRPTHQPPPVLRFVGAAQSPSVPTNAACTKRLQPSSFSSDHSLLSEKKGLGGLGHLPKIALLRGKVLVSNSLVERLQKVRKCYSTLFLKF